MSTLRFFELSLKLFVLIKYRVVLFASLKFLYFLNIEPMWFVMDTMAETTYRPGYSRPGLPAPVQSLSLFLWTENAPGLASLASSV